METKHVLTWACQWAGCAGVTMTAKQRQCTNCQRAPKWFRMINEGKLERCKCGWGYKSTELIKICPNCNRRLLPIDILEDAGTISDLRFENDYPKELSHPMMHQTPLISQFGFSEAPTRKVVGIEFRPMNEDQILLNSVIEVHTAAPDQRVGVIKNTIRDQNMGPPMFNGMMNKDRNSCDRCKDDNNECPGHFGHIDLPLHIVSPMMLEVADRFVRMMCVSCNELVLCNSSLISCTTIDEMARVIGQYQNQNDYLFNAKLEGVYMRYIYSKVALSSLSRNRYEKDLKRIHDKLFNELVQIRKGSSKNIVCINCLVDQRAFNISFEGIPRSYWTITPNNKVKTSMLEALQSSNNRIKEDKKMICNCTLGALNNCFKQISNNKVVLFPYKALYSYRMNAMVLTSRMTSDPTASFLSKWPIAPPQIRPRVLRLDGKELAVNLLSQQYDKLVRASNRVKERIKKLGGTPDSINTDILSDEHEEIQSIVNGICVSNIPDRNYRRGNSAAAIIDKHKGKEGLYRGKILGKNVDYCIMSVASPDPMIKQNQVAIPKTCSAALARPVVCSSFTRPVLTAWLVHMLLAFQHYEYGSFRNDPFYYNPEIGGFVVSQQLGPIGFKRDFVLRHDLMPFINIYKKHANPDWRNIPFNELKVPKRFMVITSHLEQPKIIDLGMHINESLIKEEGDDYIRKLVEKNYDLINLIKGLTDGMEVFIPMVSGDTIVTQRYPSLREYAASAYEVVLQDRRTIGFGLEGAAVKGLDFDGDNLYNHVPIQEQSIVEAKMIMSVVESQESRYTAEQPFGLQQDGQSCVYKLTASAIFIGRAELMDIIMAMGLEDDDEVGINFRFERPAILKPIELWTGWQVVKFGLAHGHPSIPTFIPLKNPFDSCSSLPRQNQYPFSWYDHYPIGGIMDKSNIGPKATAEKHASILYIARYCSKEQAMKSLGRLSRMANSYFFSYGFSVGLSDLYDNVNATKRVILKTQMENTKVIVHDTRLNKNIIEQEANESEFIQKAHKITDEVQKAAVEAIATETNSFNIMLKSGAKGKPTNISNMIGVLGLQMPYGEMINPKMYLNNWRMGRVLPHNPLKKLVPIMDVPGLNHDKDIMNLEEWGYIPNSLLTGLNPKQFWWMCQTDRPAMHATATNTPASGYSCRRIIACINSVVATYESLCMDHQKDMVIQFDYGHDGTNPSKANVYEIEIHASKLDDFFLVECPFSDFMIRLIQASGSQKINDKWKFSCNSSVYMNHELHIYKRSLAKSPTSHITDQKDIPSVMYGLIKQFLFDPMGFDALNLQRSTFRASMSIYELLYIFCSIINDHHDGLFDKDAFISMLNGILNMWLKTRVDPGEAVGVIAATAVAEQMTQSTLSSKHNSALGAFAANETVPTIISAIGATYRFPPSIRYNKSKRKCLNDDGEEEEKESSLSVYKLDYSLFDTTPSVVGLNDVIKTSSKLEKHTKNSRLHVDALARCGVAMGGSTTSPEYQSKLLISSHTCHEGGSVMEIGVLPSTPEAAKIFADKFLKPVTIGMCVSLRYYESAFINTKAKHIRFKPEYAKKNEFITIPFIRFEDKKELDDIALFMKECKLRENEVMVVEITVDCKFVQDIYQMEANEIFSGLIDLMGMMSINCRCEVNYRYSMVDINPREPNDQRLNLLLFVSVPSGDNRYIKNLIRKKWMTTFLSSYPHSSAAKVVGDKIYLRDSSLGGLIEWLNGSYVMYDSTTNSWRKSKSKDYSLDNSNGNRIYFDPNSAKCLDDAAQIADMYGIAAAEIMLAGMINKAIGASMNPRHGNLLTAYQTCTGNIEPFTRDGESINSCGPIKAMSYENQEKNTKLAVTCAMDDNVQSLSAATLLGHTIPIGTGYNKCELISNLTILSDQLQSTTTTTTTTDGSVVWDPIDVTGVFDMTMPSIELEGSVSNLSFSPPHETKEECEEEADGEFYSPSSPTYNEFYSSPQKSHAPTATEAMYSPSSPQYAPTSPEYPTNNNNNNNNNNNATSPSYQPSSPSYSSLPNDDIDIRKTEHFSRELAAFFKENPID